MQSIIINNIRRSRGYSYEHTLVQKFNNDGEWCARRLGGSSTNLPDIVAVNNNKGILLAIEAKSGTGDNLYVPPDQIERCQKIRDMFSYYPERHIILAFKFMNKKRFRRKNETVYENRKMVEYYKVADSLLPLQNWQENHLTLKCTYDGDLFLISDTIYIRMEMGASYIELPDYPMPFNLLNHH